ncbi:small multi-drug export protein [Patescibacteria group bacterium]|nr:small multi-drug export protein [Patescibacteria group bacterium]MBU1075538.1 small multi-drug export protein [Patescibacteria group bacterium]MBU1952177.1 small multi-drug export protein [Patescibacteria group bacterium]MBU2228932.1 small multi-drug export protein [Patescibacteria group bacterium]
MLNIDYAEIFKSIPPEWATFLIAMLPIAELRVSIFVALGAYDLPVLTSYIISVAGNLFPVVFILWLLEPFSRWLSKHFKFFKKFFDWLFERTRKRFAEKYEKWGLLALVLFVAIPLPVTGAWTGSVAAFLFGIPFRKALPLVTLGVLIAGVVVTLISLGARSII